MQGTLSQALQLVNRSYAELYTRQKCALSQHAAISDVSQVELDPLCHGQTLLSRCPPQETGVLAA